MKRIYRFVLMMCLFFSMTVTSVAIDCVNKHQIIYSPGQSDGDQPCADGDYV